MYTQCTECLHPYPISVKELRLSKGLVRCKNCSSSHDPLEQLSETPITTEAISPVETSTKKPFPTKLWGFAGSLLIITLLFQVYYFEAYNLSQNSSFRPWLNKFCVTLSICKLPQYKNIDEISILKGSLKPEKKHYVFQSVIINQAIFPQSRPAIELTLTDFTGRTFATRIFYPSDYSSTPKQLLKPDTSEKIILPIATPLHDVGGYHFKLL